MFSTAWKTACISICKFYLIFSSNSFPVWDSKEKSWTVVPCKIKNVPDMLHFSKTGIMHNLAINEWRWVNYRSSSKIVHLFAASYGLIVYNEGKLELIAEKNR